MSSGTLRPKCSGRTRDAFLSLWRLFLGKAVERINFREISAKGQLWPFGGGGILHEQNDLSSH